jgi:hypothetical protein
MQGITLLLLAFFSLSSQASDIVSANLRRLTADVKELRHDLELIEQKAGLTAGTLNLKSVQEAPESIARISCAKNKYFIDVKAPAGEQSSTFYKALREMGFLFPHPVFQISPQADQLKKTCGKLIAWRPALKYRGMHFHNLHPNEWVHGFFMHKPKIAEASVRWLARNGQNIFDMNLVRSIPYEDIEEQLKPQFELARKFEIHPGVTLGLALNQQKSYKLLNLWQAFTGWGADGAIKDGLLKLVETLPISFVNMEAGTSEFTPTNYDQTVKWLNLSAQSLHEKNVALVIKVHCSTNQFHSTYGNYNYLPQYASPHVGILPHTVMFYGLLDKSAPVYGNKDFSDLRNFMQKEKTKRPTWYYPETSYWIGMDMDLPLLITDYLLTRTQDIKWLYYQGIEGNLNFTTGQGLGYWLFDWNTALMVDLDYDFDFYTTLRLLGEDVNVWRKHVEFQHTWFKEKGLLAMLSAANLQDELSETERIHSRYTMKQLWENPEEVKKEISLLEEGLKAWPPVEGIRNTELLKVMQITKLRHQHALNLRYAILNKEARKPYVEKAKTFRGEAQPLIEAISLMPTNYPELPLFERHDNPTAYQFGYAYPAASFYFWKREERQVGSGSFAAWNGNMYNVWRILF